MAEPARHALSDCWYDIAAGFMRAQRLLDAAHERRGLPAQGFAALAFISRCPDQQVAMTPLARELHMTSGGVTKLATRLEQLGLVLRRRAGVDRRSVFASLTNNGRTVLDQAQAVQDLVIQDVFIAGVDLERLSIVQAAMHDLGRAVDRRQLRRS